MGVSTTRDRLPLARMSRLLASIALLQGCLDRPIGATEPETQNIFVKQNKSTRIDKIDVLFMIDNSLSMADKQKVMAAAVPQLLRRLTTPDCVNPTDASADPISMGDPTSPCSTAGYVREFDPVNDIHIGVITSSLGDAGGVTCSSVDANSPFDDKGWLLGALPRTAGKLPGAFLAWSQADANDFANKVVTREDEFRSFVTQAGETGCGYEMSLESWYRFLVDPQPPTAVEMTEPKDGTSMTTRLGLDEQLLAQRSKFLRPDSLLAIVMLTDENDCSISDSGRSWLVGDGNATAFPLKNASATCASSPNDPCCFSCTMKAPEGCPADECAAAVADGDVNKNLRCFDQKRRFGYDFLFPTSRYVNALKLKTICPYQNFGDLDCECTGHEGETCNPGPRFPNPLYTASAESIAAGVQPRSEASMIFLTGIVGVPWQDIAVPESLATKEAQLKYLPSSKIDWTRLLPDDQGNPAKDPLMRESVEPRSGTHPVLTNETIGLDVRNSINGHEWEPARMANARDLQYACIFELSQPLSDAIDTDGLPGDVKDCSCPAGDDQQACRSRCSCSAAWDPLTAKSPLCQDPNTGNYGNIQYAAKAYPGVRELEVLKGHNDTAPDNSIVASICPKDLNWAHNQNPGYGYNPAVAALVDRLKVHLGGTCLNRPLSEQGGKLDCAVIEAVTNSVWADCIDKGRQLVPQALAEAVRRQMKADEMCDLGEGSVACDSLRFCALQQLTDDMDPATQPLTRCQNEPGFETMSTVPGFCYIDPALGIGSKELVGNCPANQQRKLRIVGDADLKRAPAPGWTFIACSGKPVIARIE